MKKYKEYKKEYIGTSDIASLILVGMKADKSDLQLFELHFGGDGDYSAYIVDKEAEIGAHYKLVAEFATWLKIYDDSELVQNIWADKINIYRAGEYGCIIQTIGRKEEII